MLVRVLLVAAAVCGVTHALHIDHAAALRPLQTVERTALTQRSLRLKGGAPTGGAPITPIAAAKLGAASVPPPAQVLLPLMFALFKAIVGSGILSLPSSVARWTDNPAMISPVLVLSLVFAMLAGHCYSLMGQVTLATGGTSYQDAWAKAINPQTSWMPGLAVLSQTLVACVCYSIIIGDLGNDLMKGLGVTGWLASRNNLLALISATVLLPLCLLRDFKILSYFSMLGVAGVLYTTSFMVYRMVKGDYAKHGKFEKDIPENSVPQFGKRFQAIKTLILLATLNTAYQAHYDAPKFFDLMHPRTVTQFNKLVFPSFLAAGIVSCTAMAAGFLTFGGNSNGLILNSYASNDRLAVFGRLGIGCSIVFGYPLCFNGFRTGLLAATKSEKASQTTKDLIALATLLFSTSVAMVMRDLGFLAAFSGAVMGSCVIYIFPALMHIAVVKKAVEADKMLSKAKQLGLTYGPQFYASQAIVVLGCLLAVLGGTVSYLQAFTKILK